MFNPQRKPRARLTFAILKFALFDIVGMALFALGLGWFAQGPGAFFANIPGNTAEAVIFTAAGLIVMIFAASRILREVMKQHEVPTD